MLLLAAVAKPLADRAAVLKSLLAILAELLPAALKSLLAILAELPLAIAAAVHAKVVACSASCSRRSLAATPSLAMLAPRLVARPAVRPPLLLLQPLRLP
jgi:hypothetical protein